MFWNKLCTSPKSANWWRAILSTIHMPSSCPPCQYNTHVPFHYFAGTFLTPSVLSAIGESNQLPSHFVATSFPRVPQRAISTAARHHTNHPAGHASARGTLHLSSKRIWRVACWYSLCGLWVTKGFELPFFTAPELPTSQLSTLRFFMSFVLVCKCWSAVILFSWILCF